MVLIRKEMPAVKEDPLEEIKRIGSIECGKDALKHFNFAEGYRNLNHGMFLQWSVLSRDRSTGTSYN